MSMQRLVLIALVLLAAPGAWAQTGTATRSLSVGATPTAPSGTTVRLTGLASSGTGEVLFTEADGDMFRRALAKGDLPAAVGYTDEAETWSLLQTFTSGLTANGLVTIGGANDLLLGTGGMRVASGSILLRNIADNATVASFGDAAIALAQPTTITGNSSVTGTWGVSGLSTLTGGFSAGANSSIAGNLTLTGTGNVTAAGDVAVNGGDLTTTAANLNITPATSITLNGQTRLAASHTIQSANFASRTTGWGITYAGEADFRYTYADEFYTKNFIADLETALNGGQVIAKSTVILAQNFTCPAAGGTATLWVRDFPGHGNLRVFAASDWVVLRSMTRADADNDGNIEFSIGDCVGQVSAYADGTAGNEGTQSWTFTRGSGGSAGSMAASTVVSADALVIDFGVSGQGFLVARANDGTEGSQSPYWQTVTWTTAPVAANMSPRTRWGQLNGSYGYSSSTYGFAAGNPSDVFISVDDTHGIRMMEAGSVQRAQFALDGSIVLGTTGANEENLQINPTSILGRIGTTNYFAIDSGSGVTVGNSSAGLGNVYIDTSGNLSLRSGTVTRIRASASNATVSIFDDDGTTERVSIGASDARFGTTTGGRLQYTYSTGRLDFYDGSANLRMWMDAVSGLVMGPGSNGSGKPYMQLTDTQLLFCEDGGSCPFYLNGSTGSITLAGDITMTTGGDIVSTGNFSLSNANGLRFSTATSFSNPKSIQWGNPDSGAYSQIMGYTSGQLNFRSNNGTATANLELYRSSTYHTLVLGQTAVSSQDVQFLPPDSTGMSRLGNSSIQWDAVYATTYYAGTTAGYSGSIPVSASCNLTVSGGIVTGSTGVCP